VTAAARLSVKRLGFRRPVMIVRSDQPFAVGGGAAFRTALKAAGAPLVGEVAYEGAGSEEGFAALLASLAAKRPDALIVESLTEGPQIMRQARAAAAFRRVPLLGGNAFNSSSVIKAAGAAAEGLIVGAAWHPDVPGKESRAFVKAYRKRFKATPDQFAATAYTAVLAVADAVRRAQSAEPAAVRDALATTTKLPSPLGPFSFGAGRGVKAAGIVQIVRKGKFTLLR
jgi:branched-chain amino acid transport system substrate-binding protein